MRRTLLTLAAAVIALAGPAMAAVAASPPAAAAGSGPCGTVSTPRAYQHVVWVWMENHSSSTSSASSGPVHQLAGRKCGVATNYHNITHPSLPNYIAATSGAQRPADRARSTGTAPVTAICSTTAASIFGQGRIGRPTRSPCLPTATGRTPASTPSAQPAAVLHLADRLRHASTFLTPTRRRSRPQHPARVLLITPNLIDDMHDGTVAEGDSWLARNLPTILNSADYQAGNVAVFITWDEGGVAYERRLPSNTTDVGCRVPPSWSARALRPGPGPGTSSTTTRCSPLRSSCSATGTGSGRVVPDNDSRVQLVTRAAPTVASSRRASGGGSSPSR